VVATSKNIILKPSFCESTTSRFGGFLFNMKQLNEALNEFKKTNSVLKPRLCLNENTGMYLVTLGFSAQYCTLQNLKVIL